MFKRKVLVIIMLSLTFVTPFVFASPAIAADAPTAPVLQASNINILYRLLPISDVSQVDTLLARAIVAGTLTPQQARIIRVYWSTLQPVFGKNVTLLKNLVNSPNKARVKAYLRYAVGKTMRQVQADKIIQLWTIVHTPTRSAATR